MIRSCLPSRDHRGRAHSGSTSWVQSAPAYVELHRDAVLLVGPRPPAGRTWLDVGSGPGLVASLARAEGYEVTGIDRDPAMIRVARRRHRGEGIDFRVGDALAPGRPADVVSAASLLCQLPDPVEGLRALSSAVRPGGTLVVLETTAAMSPSAIVDALRPTDRRSRRVLRRWAASRQGGALPDEVWDELDVPWTRHLLAGGCVQAIVASGAPTSSRRS
jgi:SAM-dependent methyltransferase